MGYVLVFAPFVVFVFGVIIGLARRRSENVTAVANLVG